MRGRQGLRRMASLEHRRHTADLIDEAVESGARNCRACEEAGITPCTYRRWQHQAQVVEDQRPAAQRPKPPNKLSSLERERLLSVFHLPAFQSLPPSQVVPVLADEGLYLASESTCPVTVNCSTLLPVTLVTSKTASSALTD
jgi:putative transposase